MQKFISKYATAAHLAILAVAPLLLFPLCTSNSIIVVELWLVLFGLFWVFWGPSKYSGETLSDARIRVIVGVMRDPLVWISLFVAILSIITAANDGVAIIYDAEYKTWLLKTAGVNFLPCTVGEAYQQVAVMMIALMVIVIGVRHSLGRKGRACFVLVASVISGISGIVSACLALVQQLGINNLMQISYVSPSFHGVAYGIWMLAALVAYFLSIENQWRQVEMLIALSICGNGIGLLLYAPILDILVFFLLFLILAIIGAKISRGYFANSASFRCAIVVGLSIVIPALFAYTAKDIEVLSKLLNSVAKMEILPDSYFSQRSVLSGIAIKAWEGSPWIGTGFGSFPIDIRLQASAEVWKSIPPFQQAMPCWYVNVLAEQGVVGLLVTAVYCGFILCIWSIRAIKMKAISIWRPIHLLFPSLMLAALGIMYFDVSFSRPEVVLAFMSMCSVSMSAMPISRAPKIETGE